MKLSDEQRSIIESRVKPCPFCGNKVKVFTDYELAGSPKVWHNGPDRPNVVCGDCGISIQYRNQLDLIKKWNKRA